VPPRVDVEEQALLRADGQEPSLVVDVRELVDVGLSAATVNVVFSSGPNRRANSTCCSSSMR